MCRMPRVRCARPAYRLGRSTGPGSSAPRVASGRVVRRGHRQQPVGPRLAAGFVGERSVHRRRHRRVRADRGCGAAWGYSPLACSRILLGVSAWGRRASMRRALLLGLAVVTGLLALALPRPAAPEEPTFTGPAMVEEEAVSASTVWYCPWLAADASRDGWLDALDDDVNGCRDHHPQRGPQCRSRPSSSSATRGRRQSPSRWGRWSDGARHPPMSSSPQARRRSRRSSPRTSPTGRPW